MFRSRWAILSVLLAWATVSSVRAQDPAPAAPSAAPRRPTAKQVEFFERQVRPLLAEHCHACHGPKKQHADLRLDSHAALLKGSENGPVIDLTAPAASLLLRAIRHADDATAMPPDPAPKLSDAAIGQIEKWLAAGAPWPEDAASKSTTPQQSAADHWAFQSVTLPPVPDVKDQDWARTPIDRFVLAALEAQDLSPAPPAPRATLIRRVTYDLTGLPPTAEEVAAFVADASPEAFARVVDRLLGSVQYAERWARHWLDVARYADTKGYVRLAEERTFPFAFAYRDYVIGAFQDDLPYDRFILEQIAADQLPADQISVDAAGHDRRLAALGFLTLGRQFTGNTYDIIDDRIDVVSRGLLGLTVTCARCHDHKYDPIPTADYYSLYGVFAPGEEPLLPPLVSPPAADAATQTFERELDARRKSLEEYEPTEYAKLLDDFRQHVGAYLVEALAGRVLLQQPLPLEHNDLRQLVVNRWVDYLDDAGPDDPVWAAWHALAKLPADPFAEQAAALIGSWANSNQTDAGQPFNALVVARLTANPPKSMADVARAYGALLTEVHTQWQSQVASAAAAAGALPLRIASDDQEALRQVLYAANSPVMVSRQEAILNYLYDAPINAEIFKRRGAINAHLADTAHGPVRAHTVVDRPTLDEPRILMRGNPTRPGRRVPRHFLTALAGESPPHFTVGSGRLELAQAIANPDNPLTARVMVNRVWAHHFGAGLVRTPSNFGLRGERPTHPELLDYLAATFMDQGWSLKKLHRAILLSATYQQSSQDRAVHAAHDPENRLLWRANRRRLDFESLRDSLLVAAGRLDLSVGGPSVELTAASANRRTLYGRIDRQGLPGMLPTFDFASPDTHAPQRYQTTVPQQALLLMNSPLVAELAKSLAARADVTAIADPGKRAAHLIQIAWGRAPSERELQLALAFVTAEPASAVPGAAELDAWQAFAQTLLLANEFAHVD
jgi:hypothetical protein